MSSKGRSRILRQKIILQQAWDDTSPDRSDTIRARFKDDFLARKRKILALTPTI